ncbi:hypothetical protein Taro_056306, partial [Colocasia esculenta]|nr:hypothetical protein [Colocasia esculenta]
MGITFRSVIGIAYKTTIRNRHSETLDASLLPKLTISPIPSFCGSSDSLDYGNRRQSPHTEPACHGDQKSRSSHREISSPAVPFDRTRISVCTRVGTAREAPIRNQHFDPSQAQTTRRRRLDMSLSGVRIRQATRRDQEGD